MSEDPNFGDIDDAQLEAAMAALLQRSPAARSAAPARPATRPPAVPTPPADSPAQLEGDGLWHVAPDPETELGPDLELIPWATPASEPMALQDFSLDDDSGFGAPWPAPEEIGAEDLALEDAGFARPLHADLGELRGLKTEGFGATEASGSPAPGAPMEPSLTLTPLTPLSTESPFLTPPRRGASEQFSVGGMWANRKRELVPGIVVAVLALLGLAALVTAMTRDDGGNGDVSLSTPTSASPTTTAFVFDTVPPLPAPLPVDVLPPAETPAPKSSGLAPKRFRAPAKTAPAKKPAASAAPASTGPAQVAPVEPAGPPASAPTQVTSPPDTSPSTTSPPDTSPSTTTAPTTTTPRDPCAMFDDPVSQQECRDRINR